MSKSMSTHSSISYDPTGMPGAEWASERAGDKWTVDTIVTQFTINVAIVACDPMDFLFEYVLGVDNQFY